jgi:hypothetical protein
MVYMLSLLTTESPTQTLPSMLCYHINDTGETQVIRVMDKALCSFDRVVFAGERILFEAFPDAYLEVSSSLQGKTRLNRVACQLLRVNEPLEG